MLKINTTCLQGCDALALSVTRPLVMFMAQHLGWETKMYHGVQAVRLFVTSPQAEHPGRDRGLQGWEQQEARPEGS